MISAAAALALSGAGGLAIAPASRRVVIGPDDLDLRKKPERPKPEPVVTSAPHPNPFMADAGCVPPKPTLQTHRLLKLAEKRARQLERQRKGMNHG